MKRSVLFLLIGLLVSFSPLEAAIGDRFNIDGFEYIVSNEGGVAGNYVGIISLPCDGREEVVVPETVTYGNPAVTYIVSGIFLDFYYPSTPPSCSGLGLLVIPASIDQITGELPPVKGFQVDANNQYLSSQDGVLFDKTGSLLMIYPSLNERNDYAVPEGTEEILGYAFQGASMLETVSLPSSLRDIGDQAFSGCTRLREVEMREGLTSIGYSAFRNCSSLLQVTLPASLESLGSDWYYGCSALQRIDVAEGNTRYASVDGVLFNKGKDTLLQYPYAHGADYAVPAGTDTIGTWAFSGVTMLESVQLPASVKAIETSAFSNCSQLRAIDLPEGLLRIGGRAFYNCRSLTQVDLPASLLVLGTADGTDAFSGCTGLQRLEVAAGNARYASVDGVLFNQEKNKLLMHPYAHGANYAVPDGTDTIGENAFYSCTILETISLPIGLQVIERQAFVNCVSLQSVAFPGSLVELGESAFTLTSLVKADLSAAEALRVIAPRAFSNCEHLETVMFPPSLETLGMLAFSNTAIQVADLADTRLTTVDASAFYNCGSLHTVTLPPTCESISMLAFGNCSSLSEITSRAIVPPVTYNVFTGVDKSTCILWVPYHSTLAYRDAEEWGSFDRIGGLCSVAGMPNDPTLGTVLGGGEYLRQGDVDTLVAVPQGTAEFVCWKDERGAFSYNDTLLWSVACNDTVYAMFRPADASADAALASLVPSHGQLSPQFDLAVLAYADTVPYAVDSIRLQAVPRHAKALVMRAADTLAHPLQVGHNPLEVSVTAEDLETTAAYTVDVYRLNNNANLSSLRLEGGELSPAFSPTHYAYSATLPDGVKAETEAVTEDPNAVAVVGTGTPAGEASERLAVLVQAEDRSFTQTYTIDIQREAPGGVAAVNGGVICPNPVRAGVPFDLFVDVPGGRVDVFDGTGRHVLRQQVTDVRTSLTLGRKGLYLLRYTPPTGQAVTCKLLAE